MGTCRHVITFDCENCPFARIFLIRPIYGNRCGPPVLMRVYACTDIEYQSWILRVWGMDNKFCFDEARFNHAECPLYNDGCIIHLISKYIYDVKAENWWLYYLRFNETWELVLHD